MSAEADTCRKYITPAIQAAGWDDPPHSIAEQRTLTDGRIVPVTHAGGGKAHRVGVVNPAQAFEELKRVPGCQC